MLFYFSIRRQRDLDYLISRQDFFINNFVFDENADEIAEKVLEDFDYSKDCFFMRKNVFDTCLDILLRDSLYNRFFFYSTAQKNKSRYYRSVRLFYQYHSLSHSLFDFWYPNGFFENSIVDILSTSNYYSNKDLSKRFSDSRAESNLLDYNIFKRPLVHKKYKGYLKGVDTVLRTVESYDYILSGRNSIYNKFISFAKGSQALTHDSLVNIHYFYSLLKSNNRFSYMYTCGLITYIKNSRTLNPKLLLEIETNDSRKEDLRAKFKSKFELSSFKTKRVLLADIVKPSYHEFERPEEGFFDKKFEKEYRTYIFKHYSYFWRYHFLRYKIYVSYIKSLNNGFFNFKELTSSYWDSLLDKHHKGGLYFFFNYRSALSAFSYSKKVRNIKKNRFKVLKYRNSKNALLL